MAADGDSRSGGKASDRRRAQDIDRHVGARMRERRVMLGLTQQQMAGLVGVTYQQAHKYEKGINRISAVQLYRVGRILGVSTEHFFVGLEEREIREPNERERMLLQLARNFSRLPSYCQEVVCCLARMLADPQLDVDRGKPDADALEGNPRAVSA